MECGRRHFQTARIRSVSDCRWEAGLHGMNFYENSFNPNIGMNLSGNLDAKEM
jgi:hypothetical protein